MWNISSLISFLRNPQADPLDPPPTAYVRSTFDLIVTEFAFLTEHGFHVPPPTGYPGGDTWIEMKSSSTTVLVSVDRGDVSVEIGINDPIVIHRQKHQLWAILSAKGVLTEQVFTPYDPAEQLDRRQLVERQIVESARDMQKYCCDVLDGDFSIFPAAGDAAKQAYANLKSNPAE